MQQIGENLYTLELPFEYQGETRHIHPVVVELSTGVLLVDAGFPSHAETTEESLKEHGFEITDVALILVTHHDIDHVGGLAHLQERADATVFAHPAEAPFVAGERPPLKGKEFDPVSPGVEVVENVTFRSTAGELTIIETPGHTPGHISLWVPQEELLIAGDALTAGKTLNGPNEEATLDVETAIDSVERLARLENTRTLCYHGGLVEHGQNRIERIHRSLS